jgi:ABC-2 type transport system permease protein
VLSRILALVLKEFLALLKDKRSRIVLIGPPLIQMIIFGYAATFDLKNVPFAVYNEDRGAVSRELLAAFDGATSFSRIAQIAREGEIAPLVDSRQVLMVVHFSPDFTADARVIVERFNRAWLAEHGGSQPPAHIETRAWFNPNLESRWFFLPGIVGILTLLVTMLITAMSVAREREQGTFDQLLVTPLRPVEILIGKTLPGFIIGVLEASVIVLAAVFWFKVPLLGSLLTLYTGILLFLLSGVGIGLMISSFATTQQQGLLGAFMFMVPAIILSGFATPIRNMPQLVQDITLLDPMRYFLVVLRGVFLEGTPFPLLIHQFWPMALIGVVALSIAGWLFRHRMY